MNNEFDMQKMLGSFSDHETDQLKKAVKTRNVSGLMSKLSENDRKTLNTLLTDQKAREELMSSPQVQQLLQAFMKGK